jgi:tRNA (guanine37-N1)-methyltransferase
MIEIEVVTILPELFDSFLGAGLLGKAVQSGLVRVHFTNPRDFTTDRHRSVDDAPYGGGVGMVMMAPPLIAAIEAATSARGSAQRILLTPTGAPLTQARVRELARLPRLLLVCGRYEGIDERVRELAIDEEISLGDFVLTGGEPATMAIIDAVARYVPGVLGDATSADDESFSDGLLEYPQYTRPADVRGVPVPEVLLGGHHDKIRAWRKAEAEVRTRARRPDLWARHVGDRAGAASAASPAPPIAPTRPAAPPRPAQASQVAQADRAALARRTHVALVHYPVYDKARRVVATSVTNLDIHDIARASRTFGLAGYHLVTPIEAQRALCQRIIGHWLEGEGRVMNDKRSDALTVVHTAESIEHVITSIEARHGARPVVIATAARTGHATIGFGECLATRAVDPRPLLLLFGTGWGLEDGVFTKVDATLDPICGPSDYNHLSVRAAAAIVLDRLYGQ